MEHSYLFDTSFFALFKRSIFRDEKSGNEIFEVETRTMPALPEFAKSTRVIKNKITGQNEIWYSITCKTDFGYPIPGYPKGMPILLDGSFGANGDYGYALFVNYIHEASDDIPSCARFLTGLGLKAEEADRVAKAAFCSSSNEGRAEKEKSGIFTFFEQEDAESKLTALSVGEKEAKAVIRKVQAVIEERKLYDMVRIQGVEVPKSVVPKLVKAYGNKAAKRLRNDPYRIGRYAGISFAAQEEIAERFDGNWRKDSQERSRAIVYEAITRMYNNGSSWMKADRFKEACGQMARGGIHASSLYDAITCGDIVGTERDVIYNRMLRDAETRIFGNLLRLCAKDHAEKEISADVVERAEEFCGVRYGYQQKKAFTRLLSSPGIKILTGGPGTGKTTVCKGLIAAYQDVYGQNKRIRISAPTGRAAQRIAESTGMPATTVHRLLEYCPYGDSATHKSAADPIEADLIIVDEVSMMDVELFDILLEAIPSGATLLLVGDQNQLDPVGAGHVLQDLLQTTDEFIPKCLLSEVYRQQGESSIIGNAMRINQANVGLEYHDDFQLVRTRTEEDTLHAVQSLVKKLYKHTEPLETQVLCPSRKGIAGVENQNRELQKMLNPEGRYVAYGDDRFRIHDKVLMIRNNYEKDYYNGDVGIIRKIEGSTLFVEIRGEIYEITRDLLGDVKLSYSMTIHKSQGSEFKNVIVVLPKNPGNMLVRNLFYTAVTRAKENVFIVSQEDALETAITTTPKKRQTFLEGLLQSNGLMKKTPEG